MKPLNLAVSLRVIQRAVSDFYAQADEPDCQSAERASRLGGDAPRASVVGVDAKRQTVALEHLHHLTLHRGRVGLPTRRDGKAVSRMIVQDSERFAAPSGRFKITFEVHLPQCIGSIVLEAVPPRACLARLGRDQAMAMQDARDRAGSGRLHARIAERGAELASTPARVQCAQCDHGLLKRRTALRGAAQRPATARRQRRGTTCGKALDQRIPVLGLIPDTCSIPR